jgi:hypothetical protein
LNAAGGLAAGLLLGTFEVGPGRASYWVFGTPSRKVAAHLQLAAPILAQLAGLPRRG